MSLLPRTNNSAGNEIYFALKSEIPTAQTLSQNGNTISLSGGGGSVNVASTTSVALSTNKLTAVTYDTGLLETNVAGVLNVGLGSAIGSTRVEGGKVVIQRDPGEPQIEFVKGVNVERIKYDGTKLLMGSVGISGEIYDNFGSPGAAGQQLQSSGPGLPFVWGAGSGVGLTAVVAGSNISVDNTNPIAPIVSVAISSTLDMSGQNIINGVDVQLKGTAPSLDFYNSSNVRKAGLDYVESSDKITLSGRDVVAESLGAGRGHRMILNAFGAALTSTDANTVLQRSQTGVGIKTIMRVEDNGRIQMGVTGLGTNPSIALVPTAGTEATIGNVGGTLTLNADDTAGSSTQVILNTGQLQLNTTGEIHMTTYATPTFQFSTLLRFLLPDNQLVEVNQLDQVPTNQIAVPKRSEIDTFSGTVDDVNPPVSAPIWSSKAFIWDYSGTGASSRFCKTDYIEVEICLSAWGALDIGIQWGVVMVDIASGSRYQSIGVFSSVEPAVLAADGATYTTRGVKTQVGVFNHTARILCEFKGTSSITDGSQVNFEMWGITQSGSYFIDKANVNYKVSMINLVTPA